MFFCLCITRCHDGVDDASLKYNEVSSEACSEENGFCDFHVNHRNFCNVLYRSKWFIYSYNFFTVDDSENKIVLDTNNVFREIPHLSLLSCDLILEAVDVILIPSIYILRFDLKTILSEQKNPCMTPT